MIPALFSILATTAAASVADDAPGRGASVTVTASATIISGERISFQSGNARPDNVNDERYAIGPARSLTVKTAADDTAPLSLVEFY